MGKIVVSETRQVNFTDEVNGDLTRQFIRSLRLRKRALSVEHKPSKTLSEKRISKKGKTLDTRCRITLPISRKRKTVLPQDGCGQSSPKRVKCRALVRYKPLSLICAV